MELVIKKIIIALGLEFYATQFQFGRKLFGGTWFLIKPNLAMAPFWADTKITSCQSEVLAEEIW